MSLSGTAVEGYDPRYTFLIFLPSVVITKTYFESCGSDGPTGFASCIVGTMAGILRNESLFAVLACFYLTVSAIATDNPFWYAVTLLEIIFVSKDLRTAVDAVVLPLKSLMNMLLLMMIVFFVFAFYLFMAYSQLFDEGECDGIISCFFFTVYRGGWWDTIAQSFYVSSAQHPSRLLTSTGSSPAAAGSNISVSRGLFDMFFFVLISILMLNMVAGIIIDTFGSIRDTNMQRSGELLNFDFISGLPVEDIKKAARRLSTPKGYEDHAANRQHKWDYSSFIYYVLTKRTMDLSGPESYIKHLIQRKDTRWIPSSRCMLVERAELQDKAEDEDDQALEKMESRLLSSIERSNQRLEKLIREQVATRALLEESEQV